MKCVATIDFVISHTVYKVSSNGIVLIIIIEFIIQSLHSCPIPTHAMENRQGEFCPWWQWWGCGIIQHPGTKHIHAFVDHSILSLHGSSFLFL